MPEVVIGGMGLLLVFGPEVQPRGASGSSPWFLHQLGVIPPATEALLDRVKDFLADIVCHLCVTWFHCRCSFQLVYFIVHHLDLLLGGLEAHEIIGGYLHTQVSLRQGLSLAQANSVIPLLLSSGLDISKCLLQ